MRTSQAPDGTAYLLPDEAESRAEVAAVRAFAAQPGRPVVVVQGAGFVGSAMAVAVAAARNPHGKPLYTVIAVDLPRPATFWKCCRANEGRLAVNSTDEELARLHHRAVKEDENLRFTWVEEAYACATTIVVDVNLDVHKSEHGAFTVDTKSFQEAIRTIGRHMQPETLVLVESTVPPGTCQNTVIPTLVEEMRQRQQGGDAYTPFVAHSFERVMPGPNYLGSIIRFWRVFSGSTPEAAEKARAFLCSVIDVENYPLTQLADTTSSEIAKVLENSFRTTNIALMHEWTQLAETAGVDLFAIVDAIRKRKGTHDNMRYPGFGVGGYCLTKDALLADWSAREVFGMKSGLAIAADAVRQNDAMPGHTFMHLQALTGGVQGKRVLVLGVSYLGGVADTRATPTGLLVDLIEKEGGSVVLCDPMVSSWDERTEHRVNSSPTEVNGPIDCIVFATKHREFEEIEPDSLFRRFGGPFGVIDAQYVVSDHHLKRYEELGCKIRAVGRGQIHRSNEQTQ